MSADTLAERIRERADKFLAALPKCAETCDGDLVGIDHDSDCPHYGQPELTTVDLMVNFALSELSAAEKAEREQCCKDVCEDCKEGSEPNLISGVWQHHYQGEDIPSGLQGQKFNDRVEICKAAAIRNRE